MHSMQRNEDGSAASSAWATSKEAGLGCAPQIPVCGWGVALPTTTALRSWHR